MLTPKKEKFALEYLKDLNGTQAAIRAGYSKKTANEQASRLLADVNIQALIKENRDKVADESNITIKRIAEEYAKIGFAEITDYLEYNNGSVVIKSSADVAKDKIGAVSEISCDGDKVKIKLHDKISALNSLARWRSMFDDSVNLKSDALETLLKKIDGSTSVVK